jgi:uncharacterized delta-60 repeat protein
MEDTFGGDGTVRVTNNALEWYGVPVLQGNKVLVGHGLGTMVTRLNEYGVPDPFFGNNGVATFYNPGDLLNEQIGNFDFVRLGGIAVTNDRIYVAANHFLYADDPSEWGPENTDPVESAFLVTALRADNGSVDTDFGQNGRVLIDFSAGEAFNFNHPRAEILIHNGKPVVYGIDNMGQDFAIARLKLNGSLDETFSGDGKLLLDTGGAEFHARMAVQNGKLVVAGPSIVNDAYQLTIARLKDNGSLDELFSGDGIATLPLSADIVRMAVMDDQRLVIAAPDYGAQGSTKVFRVDTDGNLDIDFGANGVAAGLPFSELSEVFVEADDYILLAGSVFDGDQTWNGGLLKLVGNLDRDGDGIENTIDISPTSHSDHFSDGDTSGSITSRGGLTVSVEDLASPDGVRIVARGPVNADPAIVRIDGGAANHNGQVDFTLSDGDEVIATHGSVVLNVTAGTIEATFTADTGEIVATASLSAGTELTFEPETTTFVAAPTNTEPVTVTLIGSGGAEATTTLSAENQITFEPESFTFSAPETNTEPVVVVVNGSAVTVPPGNTVQPVQIDIKPGDSQNTVNLTSDGVIAVAIFSTVDFDATQVNASSVIFAGAFASHYALQDVNGDGRLDMLLHFRTQDTNLRAIYEQLLLDDQNGDGVLDSTQQTASVSLTGETVDEVLIQGSDDLTLFLAGKKLRDLLDNLFG